MEQTKYRCYEGKRRDVTPEEHLADSSNGLAIGLYGRGKRDQDASGLAVIHVEDRRRK